MRNAATILLLVLITAFRIVKGFTRNTKCCPPLKIGHRGAGGYCPENTFSSFYRALDLGVDYLEIDLQMTSDDELIIIHDLTVNRTTNGKGKVSNYTLKEIQALDAGSWFHSTFSQEKIPSFCEFLDEFAGKTGLLIELKKPALYPGIEEKLANELIKKGLVSFEETDRIIVQSFDKHSLRRFHDLVPAVPIGVLIKKRAATGLTNKELQSFTDYVTYVNPKITMVNKRLIKRIHHYGFKTIIWTIKKKREVMLLKDYGIEGIISDYPDIL